MKTLYLIRGPSGSGKSTLADALLTQAHLYRLSCNAYAADDYFYDGEGNYKFKPELLSEAHEWCQNRVRQAMLDETNVIIVHNTMTRPWETQIYKDIAQPHGYFVQEIVLKYPRPEGNIHGVPPEIVEKQRERLEL